jgi:uroporphyrinogen-III synthase
MKRCNLDGLGVLITRPLQQALPLRDAIEHLGGRAILFPTIEIASMPATAAGKQLLKNAADYDDLVFVSPNAVRFAMPALAVARQRVFAIGSGTAGMLQQHGIHAHQPAGKKADSESLLASPLLADMRGRKVLIVRGDGGRPLLGDTLRQRGASVDYAEVYERRCPDVDALPLLKTWDARIDVVIATSNVIIDNLLRLCRNDPVVTATPLLVISRRIREHALKTGFTMVLVAQGASTVDLLDSLCQFDHHRCG